jgi:3-dehydroquinate synthase
VISAIAVQSEHLYHVTFTDSWQDRLREIQAERKCLIITSREVINHTELKTEGIDLCLVPDGELAKDFATLKSVWDFLETHGVERGDLIVAIGGGSITDFAGFIAATWLRGVEWIAFPTTLAGMVDASVGGKTGINGRSGKNLIGSFHSPKEVMIDLALASTLSDRDFCAGLAEVIKCGFIADPEILRILQDSNLETLRSDGGAEALAELTWRSVAVKAKIVSEDFRESGSRAFLNYGHTLGHAIEHHSKYQLRHGEAVAIGLHFAAHLGVKHLGLDRESYQLHRELLNKYRLPLKFDGCVFESLLSVMRLDKKNQDGIIRFVLLREIGKPQIYADLTEDDLASAYQEVMS